MPWFSPFGSVLAACSAAVSVFVHGAYEASDRVERCFGAVAWSELAMLLWGNAVILEIANSYGDKLQ